MYTIGKFLIDAIVLLFFVGMAGSVVVIVISFVEDFRELFGSDEGPVFHDEPTPAPQLNSQAFNYSAKRESLRHL